MRHLGKRLSVVLALGLAFSIFGGSGGCGVVAEGDFLDAGYTVVDTTTTTTTQVVDIKNALIVSGSGEFLDFQYNDLVFPAQLNFDSGLYYFSPDPNGAISGDVIVCTATVTPNDVTGNCFRLGHVCDFIYVNDPNASTPSDDVYYLDTTTCASGADLGPFLVPLTGPLCGTDPFPPCPPDNPPPPQP